MEKIKKIKIKRINIVKNEDVYDLTVKNNHNFFANNILVHNCSEIALNAGGTCILGSLNLFSFVDNPFSKNAKINWKKLEKVSKMSQRFMDNIIDLEEEKIRKIIEKITNDPEKEYIKYNELNLWNKILKSLLDGRRVGIGYFGLGDLFAGLNIQYGTKEATLLAEKINSFIAINIYKESVNLAKERGCFPIWNADLESKNPFIIRVISNNFNSKEYNDYLEFGRRNIASIAQAPTGTISIISQTTSGIEPIFKIYYRRRRKINPNEEKLKLSYVDQNGDSWEEYNVIHYPFIQWFMLDKNLTFYECNKILKNLSEEELNIIIKNSPWNNSESHNIDYIEKINMLGAIQRWVDHSCSCCVTKDTLISTNDGLYYIDELTDFSKVNENEFFKNENKDIKIINHNNEFAEISSYYNNGIKPVFNLTLENGLFINATGNEKFMVYNEELDIEEWKLLSELNNGDLIKIL
jgi:ribonucleotide reductase alpha subunit